MNDLNQPDDAMPLFDVEFSVPDASTEAQFSFEAEAMDLAASVDKIGVVVGLFRAAVNAAMFSRGRSSVLEITAAGRAQEGVLSQHWTLGAIDAGAYRVLLNMLDVLHAHQSKLRAVRLRALSSQPYSIDRQAVYALSYPSWSRPAPFEISLKQRLIGAKDVLVRIEFARALSDEEFTRAETLFIAWNHLITHGGYENANGEVELDDAIVCGSTYMAAPDTLEHEFVRSVGQMAAFEALINLTVGMHDSLGPVRLFEIT
jgi:hypothetical protein